MSVLHNVHAFYDYNIAGVQSPTATMNDDDDDDDDEHAYHAEPSSHVRAHTQYGM